MAWDRGIRGSLGVCSARYACARAQGCCARQPATGLLAREHERCQNSASAQMRKNRRICQGNHPSIANGNPRTYISLRAHERSANFERLQRHRDSSSVLFWPAIVRRGRFPNAASNVPRVTTTAFQQRNWGCGRRNRSAWDDFRADRPPGRRFPDVVRRDNHVFNLNLNDREVADLVEYLKSL
jgi:hypothetical protein